MSYARIGEDGSDVYVFPSESGIECLWCSLPPDLGALTGSVVRERWVANGETHREHVVFTLVHLAQHERHGHVVPKRAWDTLHDELLTGDLI